VLGYYTVDFDNHPAPFAAFRTECAFDIRALTAIAAGLRILKQWLDVAGTCPGDSDTACCDSFVFHGISSML
jgi:hypothetical protein